MKRNLLLVLMVCMAVVSQAQFIKIGPKVGANLLKIDGQSFDKEYKFGYYVGGFAEIKLNDKVTIDPEVLFAQNQFKQSSDFRDLYRSALNSNDSSDLKLQQLQIPLLFTYKIANVLALQAGPQYSILMDKNKTLVQNGQQAFTDGDFAFSAGFKVMASKLRITGRYVVGLNNLNDLGDDKKWKSQTAQLGVGFVF